MSGPIPEEMFRNDNVRFPNPPFIELQPHGSKPRFGRHYSPDPRDRNYLMQLVLPKRTPSGSKYWGVGPTLDQGSTPRCVGYSAATCINSGPLMKRFGAAVADDLYFEAQKNDEWPGENYEGSSVRGGMKAAALHGFIQGSYVWARNLDDVIRFVRTLGPVNMGTDWFEGMMRTDKKFFVHAEGEVVGGHAWCINGVNQTSKFFRGQQTWGMGFGNKGLFKISFEEVAYLLEQLNGEAASFTEVKIT